MTGPYFSPPWNWMWHIVCFGQWNGTRSGVLPLREALKAHMAFAMLSFSGLNCHDSSKAEPHSLGLEWGRAGSSSWPMMEEHVTGCKYGCHSPPIPVRTPLCNTTLLLLPSRDGVHFYAPCLLGCVTCFGQWNMRKYDAETCEVLAHWSLPPFVAWNSATL